ncbi:deoxyribose-phosphate aldolase [Trichloromonas sp.]|uniref:deoxyribose-phosphate aldolase n=1 Tax=Trichloromonas sp. TaxID=3069249 RepID=UPI003D81506B
MILPSPASVIDHTLLKPDATADQVRSLCEEAVEYGFASVCIPPVFVPQAADLLYGSEVAVGTVVGFPLGYLPTSVKIFETAEAVARGAAEIDMVIHLGAALAARHAEIEEDIRQVVRAAGAARVKVILECCYLDDVCKRVLTDCVAKAGAAYVKTSTGFGPGGATLADVALLAQVSAGRVGVKAAGGIRDWQGCREFLAAGATRIGTSAGMTIVDQWRREQGI